MFLRKIVIKSCFITYNRLPLGTTSKSHIPNQPFRHSSWTFTQIFPIGNICATIQLTNS